MLPRDSQGVQGRKLRRLASSVRVKFRSNTTDECCPFALHETAGEKEQIARLSRLNMKSEGFRRHSKPDP